MKNLNYYTVIAMFFTALLLTANIIGEKPLLMGPFIIPAGLLLFPMTYLLGDVLTEVYGFSKARQVIWLGLFCNLFMAFMCRLAIYLPSVEGWEYNIAYRQVLNNSSRLMVISVFTYLVGEILNAYVIVKLKEKMQGKFFGLRALCASSIGEGCETLIFVPLVFYGRIANDQLIKLALFYYIFKISYVFCVMPIAAHLVTFLQSKENKYSSFKKDTLEFLSFN